MRSFNQFRGTQIDMCGIRMMTYYKVTVAVVRLIILLHN